MMQAMTTAVQNAVINAASRIFFTNVFEIITPVINLFFRGATGMVVSELWYSTPFPLATEYWVQRGMEFYIVFLGFLNSAWLVIGLVFRAAIQILSINIWNYLNSILTVIQSIIVLYQTLSAQSAG